MVKPIYLEDSRLLRVDATITRIESSDEGELLIFLDQTIFHPQGGGQKGDRGRIQDAEVVDTRKYAGNDIAHFVDSGADLEVGSKVALTLDTDFRNQSSRLHTAGHLIAHLLEERFTAAKAVRGHHWNGEARVEFTGIQDETIAIAELLESDLAQAINADFDVTINGDPYVNRMVQIGDGSFGQQPIGCGGTHVSSLSHLGDVSIRKIKRKGGTLRIGYAVTTD
jgi:Ser-tRNA(Ala) deacylase AlaX